VGPSDFAELNGKAVFVANNELWVSDGTAVGTRPIGGPSLTSFRSFSMGLTQAGGGLFFTALDGGGNGHGGALWRNDGTVSGTTMVLDVGSYVVYPGGTIGGKYYIPLYPSSPTNVNGTLFFTTANFNGTASQLWESDGTPLGTAAIASQSAPFGLTNVNGTLFFDDTGQLWKSNGTTTGTTRVSDITMNPAALANANGTLFFIASPSSGDKELWRSDGTSAGTVEVKSIGVSARYGLTNVNGSVFFEADDGTHGFQLWRSDGTAAGTLMLTDNAFTVVPSNLVNVNGTLFFGAQEAHGAELWRSDGTPSGTFVVDGNLGSATGSFAQETTNLNGTLFFANDDGVHGSQLWRSDGTAAGTQMVADINPNENGSDNGFDPDYLTNINGTLFFSANDGTHGFEPWRSDGTAAGTRMITDLNPTTTSSTSLASSPNPSTVNQVVTLTATVTPGGPGAPFGFVDFKDGATYLSPNGVQLDSSGVATLTVSSLSAGAHTITAAYAGGNFAASSVDDSAAPQVVNRISSTTSDVSSSSGASVYGQVVTFSVTVSPSTSGPVTPAGVVNFLEGTTTLGSGVLTAGKATFTDAALAVGSHTITAAYLGDDNFTVSDDKMSLTPLVKTVKADSTSTAVTSSDAGAAVIGETVTFTARVTQGMPGTIAPIGSVVFTIDGHAGSAISLNSSGQATTTLFIASGSAGAKHTVTAAYINSDGSFAGSDNTGSPFLEAVSKDSTTTTLTSTPKAPFFFGASVTYTATVSANAPGSGTPAGSVDFAVDGGAAASVALSGGKATFTPSGLGAGFHTISAAYEGNDPHGDFKGSSSSDRVTVRGARTSTVLSAPGPGSTPYGGNWSTIATVSVQPGFGVGTPTGGAVVFTATFVTNANSSGQFSLGAKTTVTIGQVPVNSSGKAVLNADMFSGGVLPGVVTGYTNSGQHVNFSPVTYVIKGQYTGSGNFTASAVSAGQVESVTRASTRTVITGASPSPAHVGQVVTLTATVQTLGGSSAPIGTVTFKDSYTINGVTTNKILGTVTLPAVAPGTAVVRATFTTSSLAQAAHSLTAVYNGDVTAPFPLPTTFPYRGQWLASTSGVFGLMVQAKQTAASPTVNMTDSKAGADAFAGALIPRLLKDVSVTNTGDGNIAAQPAPTLAATSLDAYFGSIGTSTSASPPTAAIKVCHQPAPSSPLSLPDDNR
jgi:ELWxxDGT repeat protein